MILYCFARECFCSSWWLFCLLSVLLFYPFCLFFCCLVSSVFYVLLSSAIFGFLFMLPCLWLNFVLFCLLCVWFHLCVYSASIVLCVVYCLLLLLYAVMTLLYFGDDASGIYSRQMAIATRERGIRNPRDRPSGLSHRTQKVHQCPTWCRRSSSKPQKTFPTSPR